MIGAGINGAAIAREAALAGIKSADRRARRHRRRHEQRVVAVDSWRAAVSRALRARARARVAARARAAARDSRRISWSRSSCAFPVYRGARRGRWQIGVGLALYDLLSAGKSLPSGGCSGATSCSTQHAGAESATGSSAGRATTTRRCAIRSGSSSRTCAMPSPMAPCSRRIRASRAFASSAAVRPASTGNRRAARRRACAADRQCGGAVGRRGARADPAHAPDRRHERQPHRRAAVSRRAARRRLRRGRRRSPAVLHPAVERAAADRHDRRALRRRPWRCRRSTRASARISRARRSACFPAAAGLAGRVLYTHTGVRPLPYQPRGAEGAITRRHIVRRHRAARGLYSIVGGKLTTHRALAEDVLRKLRDELPRPVDVADPLTQRRGRCRGALPTRRARRRVARRAARPVRRAPSAAASGTSTASPRLDVAALAARPELGEPLGDSDVLTAELVHALTHEWAVTLEDLLQRRCMAGLDADFGLRAAPAAAAALERLGIWDAARAAHELAGVPRARRAARRAASADAGERRQLQLELRQRDLGRAATTISRMSAASSSSNVCSRTAGRGSAAGCASSASANAGEMRDQARRLRERRNESS